MVPYLGNPREIPALTSRQVVMTAGGANTIIIASGLPAQSLVVAIVARVITAITGCTVWNFGYVGFTEAFGANLSIAVGTDVGYSAWTSIELPRVTTARDIVATAVGGGAVFTTGAIRVGLVYITTPLFTS
jgi:hypothetical protein